MSASRPNLRRTAAVPLALAVCIIVAACGGGGHKNANKAATAPKLTPKALVSKAFDASNAIDSGDISAAATINLNGLKQLSGKPISLTLSGPFQRDASGRTSAALTANVSVGSSTVRLAIDELPGHLYLGINGTYYSLPTGSSSPLHALGGASGASGATGLLGSLGIDPHTWLSNPTIVGDTTVGGVQTQHLTAHVNIANVLGDLSKVAGAVGATGSSGSSSIASALPLIESAITSAKVDIYTGVADHIVRRFDLAIAFTVPGLAASEFGGLTGGSLNFDVTLTNLGKPQTISAPASVQPAKNLLNGLLGLESKLGSLAPLFSSLSAGSGGSFGGLFSSGG
jgi:hypothetical protein